MSRDVAPTGSVLREPRHVVTVLRLLVLIGLVMLGLGTPPKEHVLFWSLLIVYGVANLGYLWARSADLALPRVKWVIFLFDVAMVSAVILLRGSEAQTFMMAYFSLVLMAAIVEGLGNAVLNAVLVSLAYVALTRWGAPAGDLLSFANLSQGVFFFVVALFMSHMASEARREKADRRRVQAALHSTSSELRQSTRQLREAREVLRANDRLAALGTLSAGIAHEMRNPLAAITSALEPAPEILDELEAAVAGGGGVVSEVRELRAIVDDSLHACAQLERVARDLTNVVRSGPAAAVPVEAAEAIEGAARMLKTRTRSSIRLVTGSTASRPALADPGRLLQVLLNLATNALDAMEPQGGGTLRLHAEDAGPGRVAFLVEDTGPGIPEEVRDRVFAPFFTTKGPGRGTGLGLHLVSEIVKALGGAVRFDTQVGLGTSFRVELPADPAHAPTELPHDPRPEDPPHRGRRRGDPQGSAAHLAPRAL